MNTAGTANLVTAVSSNHNTTTLSRATYSYLREAVAVDWDYDY